MIFADKKSAWVLPEGYKRKAIIFLTQTKNEAYTLAIRSDQLQINKDNITFLVKVFSISFGNDYLNPSLSKYFCRTLG